MGEMKHKIAACAEHAGAKLWQDRALKSLSKDLASIKAVLLCRKMEALVNVDMHSRWLNHSDLEMTHIRCGVVWVIALNKIIYLKNKELVVLS